MDSDSPLPAKRVRTTLNGNIQMTECVREFKLPRQFPSMVTKPGSDPSNDKNKIRTAVTCFAKLPIIPTRLVTSPEIPATNVVRKIKLKGKDGRDLGELNVQDLPQNIQGKTITLAKNGAIKSPEVPPADKSKGITIGVLTPVNIVKTDKLHASNSSSQVNRNQKIITDTTKDSSDIKKTVVTEKQQQQQKQKDPQGRPQVLVFQSGKNWHMVKIATGGTAQNVKNVTLGKSSAAPVYATTTLLQAKERNVIFGSGREIIQNGCEKSAAGSKICSTNQSSVVVKRWPQREILDTSVERHRLKSPIGAENGEARPKIKISGVFGPAANEPVSQIWPVAQIQTESGESFEPRESTERSFRSSANLRQDVMVVLPTAIPATLENDTQLVTQADHQPEVTKIGDSASKNCGKSMENSHFSTSRLSNSLTRTTGKKASANSEHNEETLSHLNILTKALSTVEDKELRAKALKALADCGIGMERFVPICPASARRSVKDSDTQTAVFGIVEPEHFVYVTAENPSVERIRPIERKVAQKVGYIVGNPHPQELSLTGMDDMNWVTAEACDDLSAIVEGYLSGNDGATEVRNIFTKPKPVSSQLVSQLEQDFQSYNKYDDNGQLNIHRAVIADDLRAVTRLLKVLKACNESPDLPTAGGETSLELAVRYEVSPKIVMTLLDFGADPTSTEMGHDSALIIASKKSLPLLKDLIAYVTSCKSLDNYDSSGFAALHYCAQCDNKSGVVELVHASADINVRDRRSGRTPLFHAIENEHIELAQLLLDQGAQPNIPCYSGHTVFALVEEGKHYSLAESLNRAGK